MATFTFTATDLFVGAGGSRLGAEYCDPGYLPTKDGPRTSTRPQSTRVVGGVRLTKTGLGYEAQGVRIEHHDSTPGYWHTDTGHAAKTLGRLVGQLVHAGHLTKDVER